MVRKHYRVNEREFTQEDSEGQGSLVCCSPWGCKESDFMAEQQQDFGKDITATGP